VTTRITNSLLPPCYTLGHEPSIDMFGNDEKKINGDVETSVVPHSDMLEGTKRSNGSGEGLYDPSLESKWTRLGLTLESLKRAPGTTA
jgi:hypothetical protein